jgi:hypothetical protein
VNHYGPSFLCLAASLDRLAGRQEVLTVGLQEEGERLGAGRTDHSLQHMVAATLDYRNRLVRVREEMVVLGERSAGLRARAARLQEAKQEEAMHREVRRAGERRREEELVARPVTE